MHLQGKHTKWIILYILKISIFLYLIQLYYTLLQPSIHILIIGAYILYNE